MACNCKGKKLKPNVIRGEFKFVIFDVAKVHKVFDICNSLADYFILNDVN